MRNHSTASRPTEVTLTGRVVSGLGEGSLFTALDWARAAFQDQLGFDPWPGTFNLEVAASAWTKALRDSDPGSGIGIIPPEGYCAARCYPGTVAGRVQGAVVLPEVEGYPENKLEFLAPVPVRQTLGLCDGDIVDIRVTI